ncbi:MAG: hypothetical protein RJB66_1833 [Pseudomonadota bacterium]|jgi:branched-chain amino acid aminotransferase
MISIKTTEEILKTLSTRPLHPWEKNYLAHYSSYWQGIVTDPRLLLIPVDDHLVHRGDGVFEAFRTVDNKFYLLNEHLERLRYSAQSVGLSVSWSNEQIKEILLGLRDIAKEPHLMFRLFVSRGTGGFTTNPYECPQSHLTIVACHFKPMAAEKYTAGVAIGRSQYLQKPEPFAGIKSCNYLPNVLMKKEAVDRKLDFVVAFTEKGFLTESSTENIFLLSENNQLLHPRYGSILRGTTLRRCLELAQSRLKLSVAETDISEAMLINAKEVFMAGTTLDVLPVAKYEKRDYSVGPVGSALRELILDDQKQAPL